MSPLEAKQIMNTINATSTVVFLGVAISLWIRENKEVERFLLNFFATSLLLAGIITVVQAILQRVAERW